jgi:hypothetical protein
MQETPQPEKFKAEMPQIPGVSGSPAASSIWAGKPLLMSIGLGAVLLLLGGIVWRSVHSMGRAAVPAPTVAAAVPSEPVAPPPVSIPRPGPVTAAALSDVAKPWSAKEFTFVDPATGSAVPAIVIHLPGGSANNSESYWAFSLIVPYQACHLEYVTDLSELNSRFGFHAAHPMVASACDGSVYDPLRMGTISSGAWVRGEVMQGAGLRPPIAIEVKIQGDALVADRIE